MGFISACCCFCIMPLLACIVGIIGLVMIPPVNEALTVYGQANLDPGTGGLDAIQKIQALAMVAKCMQLPFSQPTLIACGRTSMAHVLYAPAHGWEGAGMGFKGAEPGMPGVFVFSHKAVTSYQNEPNLRRDPDIFVASSVSNVWEAKGLIPKGFFPLVIGMDTDSPERIKRRTLINDAFPALLRPPDSIDVAAAAAASGLTEPWVLTDANAAERLVASLLFKTLFGITASQEFLDDVHSWVDNAKACSISKCKPFVGANHWDTFVRIASVVEKTDVGKAYVEEAKKRGFDEPANRLREMVFITLFAGVGGTGDNVAAALYITSKDDKLRPMFWKNPEAFVREAARLHPGVAGMLTKSAKRRTINFGNGRVYDSPEGDYFYAWNSAGGVDPTVFGGSEKSAAYALSFDPERENLERMLTFNAELGNILACNSTVMCPEAARPCPGTRLALKVGLEAVKYVLKATEKASGSGEL